MRTGVDLVDVERFREAAGDHGERLIGRLFRSDEAECLTSPRETAMAFAIKEAVSKALGTGIALGVSWHDIQVVVVSEGFYRVVLHGTAAELARPGSFHVSAHSTDSLAVAFAILENGPEPEVGRQ